MYSIATTEFNFYIAFVQKTFSKINSKITLKKLDNMKDFVHLHNHTHYSILDSISKVEDLVKAAKEDNHSALALTDHGVMFGSIEFYKECKKQEIKPIVGVEAYLANGSRFDTNARADKKRNYYHIILLAKNYIGYQNLMKLTTKGNTEGFYYKPRIDNELLEMHHEGIICTSACMGGVISNHIINNELEIAYQKSEYYKNLFGDDFYLEIQDHFFEEDKLILKYVPQIAKDLNIKLVATNDVHYVKKEEAMAHNVMLNIRDFKSTNSDMIDLNVLKYRAPEFYFKSKAEMNEIFKDFPDALENTIEIAEKCNLDIPSKVYYFPDFKIPEESKANDLKEYCRELVEAGIKRRYPEITTEIRERTDFELNVILNMGFVGYFLIVADFIDAARKMGVRVGPGRGSAAGSIVAYALGITDIEPLQFGLLFERFLNPDRVSMPDIDVDFNDEKREKVFEYVKEKYGEQSVAMIVTFGKLSSKAVLTDVARILKYPLNEVKKITKQIPTVFGKVHSIEKAIKEVPALQYLQNNSDPLVNNLITFGMQLENRNRNTGIHAAGVVIAPGDLTDYVPLIKQGSKKADGSSIELATQYNMKYVEEIGLVKMDFLGLTTLSIIDRTLDMIKANHNIEIDIDNVPIDDEKTYKIIGEGNTLAIFQFESSGMMDQLRKLKPKNLEEIAAMNALYRPGPMENIPSYIARKQGKEEIKYLHPLLESSLGPTFGIVVYQEQAMTLSRDFSGFTLAQSDILRKAMGKKDHKMMDELKPKFIQGAMEKGVKESIAIEVWELMRKFADYGFNKSHAIAYSYIAYQTAYLKAHYPAEFIAANMSKELNNQSKLVMLKDEAAKFNIEVVAPDVNTSDAFFKVKNNTIYFGMAGIKGVGTIAVESIMQAREDKPFISFFDFVARVDKRVVNKRALESLICAGAFDSLNSGHRAALMVSIESALDYAKAMESSSEVNMDSLFGGESGNDDTKLSEPSLPIIAEWSEEIRLQKEREVLNFYVSGHPLKKFEKFIKGLRLDNASELALENGELQGFIACGLITEKREMLTNKGDRKQICFFKMEDFSNKFEGICWSDTYEKYKQNVNVDEVVVVFGTLEMEENETKIVCQKIMSISEVFAELTTGYSIWLNRSEQTSIDKIKLFEKFSKEPFYSDIIFNFFEEGENSDYKIISKYKGTANYQIDFDKITKLEEIFGKPNVNYQLNEIETLQPPKRKQWGNR